jgi:hypothetical protein
MKHILRKQLLLKLGVFLLLGVVVNVAVAWGCAALVEMPIKKGRWWVLPLDTGQQLWKSFARQEWNEAEHQQGNTSQLSAFGVLSTWVFADDPESIVIESDLATNASRSWGIIVHESGWPTLSTRYVGFVVRDGNTTTATCEWCWQLTDTRTLPLRPIWSGFIINTIIYSVLLWLIFVGPRVPGKIRRFIRVQRGRCPACGYIIAPGVGNKCSECGNPLSLRRSAGM